ncbi:MAG: hypothetical protein ACE5H3_05760, partial [Planctomycetota bacterium]
FKLDADPSWDDSFLETLAAWGRVACLDLKSAGQAGAGIPRGRLDFFRKLTVLFPEAWIEDPPLFPEDRPLWEANWNRISWDAPIRSVEDILRLPRLPAGINVKPSRIGSLERLFAVYAFCLREGISLYGGGMFEIGVGRRQLAILAAMFHPEAPNDVAPSAWHTEVPGPGLPDSPLTHPVPRVGFH